MTARVAANDAMRLVQSRMVGHGRKVEQVGNGPQWVTGCPTEGHIRGTVRWDQHTNGTVRVHACGDGCTAEQVLAGLAIDDHRIRPYSPNGDAFTGPARVQNASRTHGDGLATFEKLKHALEDGGFAWHRAATGRYQCPACGAAGDGHGLKVDYDPNRPRRILLLCFQGCPTEEILEPLGMTLADLCADDDTDDLGQEVSSRTGDETPETRSALEFTTLADLCARVDAAGPRQWLIRGIWPGGAYGVHAADMKAQKTWNALDLAVSTASGTDWLNTYPIDDPGPVVIFAGEGGEASIVRRIRAICASRDLTAENLPITICTRAPHLGDAVHMLAFADHLEAIRPRLVLLDPLYLSMGGADGKDLYGMGRLLERPQILCDQLGASLVVVTHFNRSQRTGPQRITGAGPAEWGRVIVGAEVKSRHTDPATKATTVITQLDVIGSEVPDQTFRVKRVIVADDPDDLDSPLTYSVDVGDGDSADEPDMPPARWKLLQAVKAAGKPTSWSELVDWIAATRGHGLKRQTASTELNALLKDGLVDRIEQPGHETLWTVRAEGVSGVMTTPTRHPTTGASEGVVAVVALKATATPDTPGDTTEGQPGTGQYRKSGRRCAICDSPVTRLYPAGWRCDAHRPGAEVSP
jgi:hypothetical protein